ncbi:MAG: hypothetical protein IPO94_11590 [Saprospiraceae bacterium]|nr:hypothetical protein [Saprospiraceae bacterium]
MSISYQRLAIGFTVASANMSNKDGKLLFYFNGCDLANAQHEIVENGTGFNPGQIATKTATEIMDIPQGYQSSMILTRYYRQESLWSHNTIEFMLTMINIPLWHPPIFYRGYACQ